MKKILLEEKFNKQEKLDYFMDKEKIIKLYNKVASWYDLRHHLQTLWADDLHRKEVVKVAEIKDKENVLDLGTGTALTAIFAYQQNQKAKITGIDFSEQILKKANENLGRYNCENKVKLIKADMEKMPFDNNYFDKIISAYGLGACSMEKVMKEIVRVAKPNARITLGEMTSPPKKYKFRKLTHDYFVEPWINFFWEFKDTDLVGLFKENKIFIDYCKWHHERIFGSTTIISGIIKK